MFHQPMAAGTAVLNGAGELTGSMTIREWGTLETPVVLTATMSVGMAYQGRDRGDAARGAGDRRRRHRSRGWRVRRLVAQRSRRRWLCSRIMSPRRSARATDGCRGRRHRRRIGNDLPRLERRHRHCVAAGRRPRLGALVLTNFGALERLCVNGVAGRATASPNWGDSGEREAPEGSCIVVIATDAPMLPAQCERRGPSCRTGPGAHAVRSPPTAAVRSSWRSVPRAVSIAVEQGRVTHDVVGDRDLDGLFAAAVEATEEAVMDSLFRATTTHGRHGRVAEALPIDELLRLM